MKKLHIVSHTHWDREWYDTFQTFRRKLVGLVDELLDVMENNENYRFFHTDGQTIMLEDYLKIRPENEERLRKLIQSGRIIIGPWYVMPDEFLVSGESLVRNIQKGLDICKKYEVPPMNNGYVSDIFGHNSQMPQILCKFDINSATVLRGFGKYDRSFVKWMSPDGSVVNAIKLDKGHGYGNFYLSVRRPFIGVEPTDGGEYTKEEVQKRLKDHIDSFKDLGLTLEC